MTVWVQRLGWFMTALILLCGSRANGKTIWFDEGNQKKGYDSFGAMASGYQQFMGLTSGVITFDDLPETSKLSTQYSAWSGVTFSNTAGGPNGSSSGVWAEGGPVVENLTGYDGSYHPNSNRIYVKFDNEYNETPFTILFSRPVSEVGSLLVTGVEGSVHSLDVTLYDSGGRSLGNRIVNAALWENTVLHENYETFFGVRTDGELISRVEIRNLGRTNYSNALGIDDLAWSGPPARMLVPEPATLLMLSLGSILLSGSAFVRRTPGRGSSASPADGA